MKSAATVIAVLVVAAAALLADVDASWRRLRPTSASRGAPRNLFGRPDVWLPTSRRRDNNDNNDDDDDTSSNLRFENIDRRTAESYPPNVAASRLRRSRSRPGRQTTGSAAAVGNDSAIAAAVVALPIETIDDDMAFIELKRQPESSTEDTVHENARAALDDWPLVDVLVEATQALNDWEESNSPSDDDDHDKTEYLDHVDIDDESDGPVDWEDSSITAAPNGLDNGDDDADASNNVDWEITIATTATAPETMAAVNEETNASDMKRDELLETRVSRQDQEISLGSDFPSLSPAVVLSSSVPSYLFAETALQTTINMPISVWSPPENSNDNASTSSTEVVDWPTGGGLSTDSDGSITYAPNEGFVGVDRFSVQICNAMSLQCRMERFVVTVVAEAAAVPQTRDNASSNSSSDDGNGWIYGLAASVTVILVGAAVVAVVWIQKQHGRDNDQPPQQQQLLQTQQAKPSEIASATMDRFDHGDAAATAVPTGPIPTQPGAAAPWPINRISENDGGGGGYNFDSPPLVIPSAQQPPPPPPPRQDMTVSAYAQTVLPPKTVQSTSASPYHSSQMTTSATPALVADTMTVPVVPDQQDRRSSLEKGHNDEYPHPQTSPMNNSTHRHTPSPATIPAAAVTDVSLPRYKDQVQGQRSRDPDGIHLSERQQPRTSAPVDCSVVVANEFTVDSDNEDDEEEEYGNNGSTMQA